MIVPSTRLVGELAYLGVPLLAVIWATVVDLIRREIPDWIPLGVTLWAIFGEFVGWLPFRWESLLLGLATGFLLGAVGFWLESFGGGDVKLLAALGASIGFSAIWTLLFWTALAGGVLALVAKWRGERELAFAPAIALGFVACIVTAGIP